MPVAYDHLREFIATAFERVGMPRDDAATVAALMAEADLQGSDGHGVTRLPRARQTREGLAIALPVLETLDRLAAELGIATLKGD